MKVIKIVVSLVCIWVAAKSFVAYGIEIPDLGNPDEGASQVSLNISTDKEEYTTMETIWFDIAIEGEGLSDVYLSVTFPDETFASYTSSLMPDGEGAVIPMIQGFPVSNAEYRLPLPVIPLWPEGTSEIWMILVAHQKNPLNPANWLADDKVAFNITQTEGIDPFFDVESKTFSAEMGEMGTIEIQFDDGNVHGVIFITGEDGNVYELQFTGTYAYEDKTLMVHIEGAHGFFFADFTLSMEDGLLYGEFTTSTGASGSVEFNPLTQEVAYDFERATRQGTLEELGDVTVTFEDGEALIILTVENQHGEIVEKVLMGTAEFDAETKTFTINVTEVDGEYAMEFILYVNDEGMLVGEYTTSNGKTGSAELDVLKAMLEHLGIVDNTFQVDLGESGTLTLTFEDGEITGTLSVDTLLMTVERSVVASYEVEGNAVIIVVEGEEEFSCTLTLTFEDGTLTGGYTTGNGKTGSTEMTLFDNEVE